MKKLLFIFILGLVFSACSDSFLETENKNNLDVGSFFKTENDLLLATNAAYTPFAHGGMFGNFYLLRMNQLDPYVWFENPKSGFDQMIINTSDFDDPYKTLYIGLFRTSDILANINRLKDVVEPVKFNEYKGQVTALRGMYYFYLVTWFNAPIYYDETSIPTDPLKGLPNGTQEQFWNKLEEDLTFASENLPDRWSSTETGRMTKGTANAALGKALLYKHYHYYLRFGKGGTEEATANLTKAKAAFKRVKDSNVYELIKPLAQTKEDYQAALLSNYSYLDIPVGLNSYKAENNKESVWEIQYNDDNRAAEGWLPGWQWGGNLNYAYMSPLGYRNLEIDPTLWYAYETAGAPAGYDRDPRAYATSFLEGDLLDWRPGSGYRIGFQSAIHAKSIVAKNNLYQGPVPSVALGLKKYNYPQFVDKSAPNSAPFNVRVIRYADVLLMLAEASYQLDGDADGSGLAALNEVRARAGMPAITELTAKAIVHERDLELSTEGHRYNDIVRWMYDPKFEIDLGKLFNNNFNKDKHYTFPIPQAEIDANRGVLKQNSGW
ncbi:MAG TPA: RagB/SusD family nutrient uptake outer membrane protein [Prolixibacteraceae bacterium]|nr:RagB/SusD family nutrient uptake outer membrane protein [Prolixibacteraceae bacterium]